MDKELVGYPEAMALVIIAIGAKAFLGYPRIVVEAGLTAAWLLVLLSGFLSIIFWLLIVRLLARFPGKSLVEITEILCGPVLGTIINVFVFAYSILTTGIYLRLFSEAAVSAVLSDTPVIIIALIFIVVAWWAVYYGVEIVFYSAYFFYIILTVVTVLILVALYTYYDLKFLLPFWGAGWPTLIPASFWGTTAFAEVVILAYLIPYFSFTISRLKKIGVWAISFILVFFTAIIVVLLMVLPVPTATEVMIPFFQLARGIFLGHYFQRVEAFFLIFWAVTAFLRIAIGILVAVVIWQDTFKLPYYRPIIPVICLLTFSLVFAVQDFMTIVNFEARVRMPFGWLVVFVVPLLLWLVALLRGKGEKLPHEFKN